MERVDGFDATVAFIFDMLALEGLLDGLLGAFEFFVGLFQAFSGEFFQFFIASGVDIFEAGFFDFDARASHLKAVGEWRKNFERLAGDFLLFFGRESAQGAQIVKAVSKFDDENTDVLAGSNE